MGTVYIAPTHEEAHAKVGGGGRPRGRPGPGARAGLRRRPRRGRRAGPGLPRRRPRRRDASRCRTSTTSSRWRWPARRSGRWSGPAPGDAGGGPADRRDPQPGPAQPRDHLRLLAARRGDGAAHRAGRELVHVRDLGLAPGRPDDPRRGRARLRAGPARARPRAAASRCSRSGAGCCGAGCSTATRGSGRITARLHTPFDAIELASDAVARGNLKVFEEIGYEFARYLAGDGAAHVLRDRVRALRGAANARPTRRPAPSSRCWPTSRSACTSRPGCSRRSARRSTRPYVTAEDLGRRLCGGRGGPRLHRAVGPRRGAGPAPAGAARARGDHGLADGALAPRPDPRARRRTSTTRIRRSCTTSSNAELVGADRALRDRPATTPARATGRTWTSGCTTSSTCSAASTRARTSSTRRSRRAQVERFLAGVVPEGDL